MTNEEKIIEWLSKYIDHDIDDNTYENMIDSMLNLLDANAAEQRELCADAAIVILKEIGFQIYDIGEERIRAAIINATGEKDGK